MSFNPITDLRLDSDDKIEDSPAVNIEVELLPLLRRTALKTKQVANVIKSNNSLLKSDLERITTLRRRLQRVIPVIPRVVGSAGAIFGEGMDRESPPLFPFLMPLSGKPRPKKDYEENREQNRPKVRVPIKEKEIQKEKELIKDKNAVRANIRELIGLGTKEALEEAKAMAEEAGILSEFPELALTDITNKENQKLFEKFKKIMETKKKEKVVETPDISIEFNGTEYNFDYEQISKDALKDVFMGSLRDPLTLETKQWVLTPDNQGLMTVAAQRYMTDKVPSPYLLLTADYMRKQAIENGENLEFLSESGYKINAFSNGKIMIYSPKYQYDLAESIRTDPLINFMVITQALLDVIPSGVPRGQIFSRGTNYSKTRNVKRYKPFDYTFNKTIKKKLNQKVLEKTFEKNFGLDRKRANDLIKRLNTSDFDSVIDSNNLAMLKVILAGKYNRSAYTKAEQGIIDSFIDSTIQLINDGDIKSVDELNSFLKYVQSGASPSLQEVQIDLNKLLQQFQKVNEFVGSGGPDLSSLNIDTGDNTLIVLMGNDDSPIPSFG